MTPELVAAIVACLGALSAFLKSRSDISKVNADRAVTKAERDLAANDLRDQIMKNTWDIGNIRRENETRDTLLKELSKQVELVNCNLSIVSTKLDNLVDAIKGKKG